MDNLEAGRELDALVAEKVMGLNLTVIPETCPYCYIRGRKNGRLLVMFLRIPSC